MKRLGDQPHGVAKYATFNDKEIYMQKKLIALAIAGLSSAAFAQSNVTVYGVIAAAQESVKAVGAATAAQDQLRRGRLASNSSLIGFKGTEALGNGMTAVFQLENSINADAGSTSAGTWNSRDTFVGLTGGFGTVVGGNLTHPMRAMGAKVDNNPGASSIGFTGSMYGEMNGVKTGTDERAANAIAYVSPSFSGLTATVAYVNGESARTPGSTVNQNAWQVAGAYENGPLYVGAAHHNATDAGVLTGNLDNKFKANRIVAAYSFGGTRLSALWDSQKATLNATSTDLKRNAFMVGAAHTFGANKVFLQYAKAKDLTGSSALAGANTGSKQVTVGFAHDLSKRTTVHAYYAKITNESAAQYDFYVGGVGGANNNILGAGGVSIGVGSDPTGYGLGLRHAF
jgi:predicted porin